MVELGTTNVKFYADQPFNLILTIPLIIERCSACSGQGSYFRCDV